MSAPAPKDKQWKPRLDRFDIYNNLPAKSYTRISEVCGFSVAQVKNVLEGKRTDHQGIIREAELMAAINIWKTRFCKFKSQL